MQTLSLQSQTLTVFVAQIHAKGNVRGHGPTKAFGVRNATEILYINGWKRRSL